jgi:quercetin 2,3-dioxygenase
MQIHRIQAQEMNEGDGARVRRLFPVAGLRHHDPFVLFDNFSVGPNAGFPPHPHRGFEAITYLFDGAFRHEDNLGNRSTVTRGGAQRFTAGRGLIHSEMPAAPETSHGIQLWINLAKSDKHIEPGYQQVDAAQFPEEHIVGGHVRTLVGPGSPLQLHTPVLYLDMTLAENAAHTITLPADFNGLVYVVSGKLRLASDVLAAGEAALLTGGGTLRVEAIDAARCVCAAGQPHNEPIIQHGPYVD